MKAPNFSLPDQNENVHNLADYQGRWVVLYFYPKDNTPGCTVEACEFRDAREKLKELGAEVIGVSKDNLSSHKNFSEKFELNFPILSDPELNTIKAYGAWGEKKFLGKAFMGVLRKTFIISPEGKIVKEYPKVTPKDHAAQIFKDLKELMNLG